jgi:hypothetical protein
MVTRETTAPTHAKGLAASELVRKGVSFPVFLAALLVGAVFVNARLHLIDPDTWWHVAVGERILATGTWPHHDIYSFTASHNPWIAYEWLGEVTMALAARLGGLVGLTLLLVLLSSILFLLLYYYATLHSGNMKAGFLAAGLLLFLGNPFFTLRPQLIGYILLVLTLVCLERFQQGHLKAIWWLPLIFLVWVNTHGSFALGLAFLGVYWACGLGGFEWGDLVAKKWSPRELRHMTLALLGCVAVLPLTPYGTQLAAYPIELALLQPANVANIQEWQTLDLHFPYSKILLGLLLAVLLAQIGFRIRHRLPDLALVAFAVYAAADHLRFLVIFVIVFAPWLASVLARWTPPYDPGKDQYLLNAAIIVLVLAGIVRFVPSAPKIEHLIAKDYPVDAVRCLRQHPVAGPTFNTYGWGGYLIWKLPESKVFIDGRADLYEYAGVFKDYLAIMNLERDPRFLLSKYGVRACLIRNTEPLAVYLEAEPGWQRIYQDKIASVFVRVKPGAQAGPAGVTKAGQRAGTSVTER